MATSLHIRRLRARYRVSAARAGDPRARPGAVKDRLDRVLRDQLGRALEGALAALGLPEHEEVCVRAVPVRTRLSLGVSDEALARAWSAAIARALREQLASGAGVVRYGSRVHALVDLLAGVAEGALGRAWAWRQLGLWDGTGGGAPAVRALAAMPEAAPAALAAVERAGAIAALARRVDAAGWCMVAARALAAAGVDAGVLEGSAGDPRRDGPAAAAVHAEARRIAGRARFAAALAAPLAGGREDARARRALAALAALAAEPAALRHAGAPLVDALADALAEEPAAASAAVPVRAGSPERRAGAPAEPAQPSARAGGGALSPLSTPAAPRPATQAAGANRRATEDEAPARDDVRPLPAVRCAGRTRAGGLLYLLHIVAELGLPDALCNGDGPLASRPLRWALHALALALLPVEARDPAALAFCGAAPGDDPPDVDAPPAVEAERAALAATAAAVAERLRTRLRRDEEPVRAVLLETCRRDAEIVADPAWLEIRLSLDDVDTRVRRAGLDLDPGWLPWLGCVVRFVHA